MEFEQIDSQSSSASSLVNTNKRTQVSLHKWFLIRVVRNHLDNDMTYNGVQVALGGYITPNLVDHEMFTTAPIECRLAKCKLRTVDGLYILLMGSIDEERSCNDGIPCQVVHLFLTGFPFNWNIVINAYFGQPSLNKNVPSARIEEDHTGWQIDEAMDSKHSGKQVEGIVTSPRESPAKCSKRGRYGAQTIRMPKELKCAKLDNASEPQEQSPFVESHEASNISKESDDNLSLFFRVESVRKEVTTPWLLCSYAETCEQFKRDDILNFSESPNNKDSINSEKNVLKSVVSQSIQGTTESKKLMDRVIILDADKLTKSPLMITTESTSEKQTNILSFNEKSGVKHLEQFENIPNSAGEKTLDIHISQSKLPQISSKTRNLGPEGKSCSKQNGRNFIFAAPQGISCDATIGTKAVKMTLDAKCATHFEEIICTGPLYDECSPFDPECRVTSDKIMCCGTNRKGQFEVLSSADVGDSEFIHLKKDALSDFAEHKTFPVAENHLNTDTFRDVPYKHSNGFFSNQATVMQQRNDADSTCGNPHLVTGEIQHDMPSEHCITKGRNCLDNNGDKEKGNLFAKKSSTEKIIQSQANRRQLDKKLLSLPPRCVMTTPEEVSKGFGLRSSRSGRLIVPPLAHWWNQTIAYDLDQKRGQHYHRTPRLLDTISHIA